MSADAPLGEYVDVAPAAPAAEGKVELPRRRATDSEGPSAPTSEDSGLRRRSGDLPAPASMPPKLLRPAQAESWQASSFDLLSGCRTRDVTDTIPDNVFDELFGPPDAESPPRSPPKEER